jgi:hypothetical protein
VVERARRLVFEAVEAGWTGPPYDPIRLADLNHIAVVANPDVVDARTTVSEDGAILVEFNPNQPRGRRRYSIAHEISHTLFADVAEQVRHRMATLPDRSDDWQLELLCNVAAAEMLMPAGSLPANADEGLGIDQILALRSEFDVSVEAITLRLVKLMRRPVAAFAASKDADGEGYRVDYFVPSPGWSEQRTAPGQFASAVIAQCVAIGFTAKGVESWWPDEPSRHVECVGIPPYPGQRLPRVVGLVWPTVEASLPVDRVMHVQGNALKPRGSGNRVLVHIVNDRTPRWGGGFALAVASTWPAVQRDFLSWTEEDRSRLRLGGVRMVEAAPGLYVASIIAMHGYGPAAKPRIRYGALEAGLRNVERFAHENGASVHAPRLGAGQAGGAWSVVEGLLEEALCAHGVPVTVYTVPGSEPGRSPTEPKSATQLSLSS